jgi:hypothetical protein
MCLAWAGCATGGAGTSPPLPGVSSDDTAASDDATSSDDGGPLDDAPSNVDAGGSCDDFLHGLRAVFVIPPVTCSSSADCPSGDCCYSGTSGSSCVMQ